MPGVAPPLRHHVSRGSFCKISNFFRDYNHECRKTSERTRKVWNVYPFSYFLLLHNPMKMIIFAYKNKTDKSNGQDCSQGYHNKDNV